MQESFFDRVNLQRQLLDRIASKEDIDIHQDIDRAISLTQGQDLDYGLKNRIDKDPSLESSDCPSERPVHSGWNG